MVKKDQLPIDSSLPGITQTLMSCNRVIIISPPGSGKTTRVPPAVAPRFPGKTVLLQPRRVAVRSCAQRIADENQWKMGEEIGWQIRFDKRMSKTSRILVITEGILSRWLQSDPTLRDISCIILDEFHERNINSDFALAWIKQLQESSRNDLKLIIMSATMETELLSTYLGQATVIAVEGKVFPLETVFLRRPLSFLDPKNFYDCDISMRVAILQDHEKWSGSEVNRKIISGILKTADHLQQQLRSVSVPPRPLFSASIDVIAQLLLLGFSDCLSRRRDKSKEKAVMVGGRGIRLDRNSCVQKGDLFLSLNATEIGKAMQRESIVTLASKVQGQWVSFYFSDEVHQAVWTDERKGKVPKHLSAKSFFQIPLEAPHQIELTPEYRAIVTVQRLVDNWEKILITFPKFNQWLLRIEYCKMQGVAGDWPTFDRGNIIQIVTLAVEESTDSKRWTAQYLIDCFEILLTPDMIDFTDMRGPKIAVGLSPDQTLIGGSH